MLIAKKSRLRILMISRWCPPWRQFVLPGYGAPFVSKLFVNVLFDVVVTYPIKCSCDSINQPLLFFTLIYFTAVMQHFLPWYLFTALMQHFLPWYHFTAVMWHSLPWHHFTPVIEHFLPWYLFFCRDATFSTLISFFRRDATFSTSISF